MTPKAITCDALRVMCETDGQRAAVMIAVSERGTQFTTWGKLAEDKVYARDLSNHLSEYLCCGPRLATHEDFVLDAAKVKENLERMLSGPPDDYYRSWLDDEDDEEYHRGLCNYLDQPTTLLEKANGNGNGGT